MDAKDILQFVQGGEKLTIEYKKAWNVLPANLFETVCAFLNRDGGTILLGVNDDGTITNGVDTYVAEQLCKNIANLSNNNQKLNPTFLLQPEIVRVSNAYGVDVPIIVIQVPSSSQVHQSAGKIYDRSRDGDFEVRTDAERSALYQRKSMQYSENKIFPYLKLEHLNSDVVQKAKNLIRNNRSNHPWLGLNEMDFFKQSNLFRTDISTGESGFTLAALMLFGNEDIIQSALPYYRIDAIVRLNDVNRYDDRISIGGNIVDAYEQIMQFIAKHLPDKFYMENDKRISLRDQLFREVVANMLIHREYLNPTPTTIEIGVDGVVCVNANRPLKMGPVTLDNYVRHPKNPHIANFFVQLGWAEHLGTGIRNIYKYASLYTDRDPSLDDEDLYTASIPLPTELQTIVNETLKQKELQRTLQRALLSLQLKLTKNQFDVLSIIVANNVVNRNDIMIQLHIPESSVISCISALKRKGILVREGGKRYGKWRVNL